MPKKKQTNSQIWDSEINKIAKILSKLEKKGGNTTEHTVPNKPKRVTKSAIKRLKNLKKNITKQSKSNNTTGGYNNAQNMGSGGLTNTPKKQSKMQKEWAKQEKNLKRRIRNLSDKGYDVSGITIPEKPTIITKKKISQLTDLTRRKLLMQVTHKLPTGETISGIDYDKIQRKESAKKGQLTKRINQLKKENPNAEVDEIGGNIYIIDKETKDLRWDKDYTTQQDTKTKQENDTTEKIFVDTETGEFFDETADLIIENFYAMLGSGSWESAKHSFEIMTQNDIIRTILDELISKFGKEIVAQKIQEAEQNGVQLNYEILYNLQGNIFINDFLEYFNINEEERRKYSNYISDITSSVDI